MQAHIGTILVTGGAGYIGSAVTIYLIQQNYHVVVIDQKAKPAFFNNKIFDASLSYFQADFADQEVLKKIFTDYTIHAVMHFAAFIEVGASVKQPARFYENNVSKTIQLLDIMRDYNISNFIFSSSCAIYGLPEKIPLEESHPKNPISPYGKTKHIIELVLQDYERAYGLKYVTLRYFNAAGEWPEFGLRETHEPETHVIPILLKAARTGEIFTVFGTDYNTPDGTCIRDYLHIRDLATAHLRAVKYLDVENASIAVNLGTGYGYSIKELIKTVEHVLPVKIDVQFNERRAGDPDILIANPARAHEILGWQAQFSSLENIIETSYLQADAMLWLTKKGHQAEPDREN